MVRFLWVVIIVFYERLKKILQLFNKELTDGEILFFVCNFYPTMFKTGNLYFHRRELIIDYICAN